MLKVSNLHFHYGSAGATREVLRGIDLHLSPGASVALMGANGAGKSTFARCLNGLLLPTAGEVEVCGLNTRNAEDLRKIRCQVGMVFQNPENQIVSTTVEREIAFGLENLGVAHARMRAVVDEMLARFDLGRHRNRPPHLLSGGEMQRLALASVVAMSPRLVVFDEPTSLLDPANRLAVLSHVADLREKSIEAGQPMSTLLITQHPEETLGCDRLLILHEGRILFDAAPHDVFAQVSELKAIGLAAPIEYELKSHLETESGEGFDPREFERYRGEKFRGQCD